MPIYNGEGTAKHAKYANPNLLFGGAHAPPRVVSDALVADFRERVQRGR
jgi:hypothetical protein